MLVASAADWEVQAVPSKLLSRLELQEYAPRKIIRADDGLNLGASFKTEIDRDIRR